MQNDVVENNMRYIVITGGVISGVGKGIIASSTGVLLKSLGLRVTSIKIDPYLNIDAGTLSPFDHGEVYVLDDGGEVDLDLGNYERFLDITLTKNHNITTGKVYQRVIEKERKGDYLGKTVQVVPHVTNAIQDWIQEVAVIPVDDSQLPPQVCIVEVGGTVGDIESAPFVEAMRQFQFRVGRDNFLSIHVALVPTTGDGEQKSKPMQSSVRDLRGLGLTPDIIACRSSRPLEAVVREKISMFCHVPPENVISVHDCESTYHVPVLLEQQNLLRFIHQRLNLQSIAGHYELSSRYWHDWLGWLGRYQSGAEQKTVVIGVVGKYTELPDAYISIARSIVHAATHIGRKCKVQWIEASKLEGGDLGALKECHALVIAGGFGERGTLGKIMACNYSRVNSIPLLGICLGFQLAVVEWCRSVLGLTDAHSTEFNAETKNPVVIFMPEGSKTHLGGTMRLGSRVTKVQPGFVSELYKASESISERHRHRYEVNPEYVSKIEASETSVNGVIQRIKFVGKDEVGERMEILHLEGHPYFVGVQYHPEYKSRTLKPSPVFLGLLQEAAKRNLE